MTATAAIAATIVLAGLAMFQAALAAGAPLGRFAWGGQRDKPPAAFRIASAATIPLYGLMAIVLLDRAGVTSVLPGDAARIGAWVIFAYMIVGTVTNLISRSRSERFVMTPVAAVLAILSAIVAAS
jgi:hypothetical protein